MAYACSFVRSAQKDLHFMDFKLGEFDVRSFAVVAGPSGPDVANAKNLDGENSPISGSRP